MDSAIRSPLFRREEEGFAWFRGPGDELGNVAPHGRPMLESVARTAPDEPDIVEARVPIDHEVAVGTVLVLADPRFTQGRAR